MSPQSALMMVTRKFFLALLWSGAALTTLAAATGFAQNAKSSTEEVENALAGIFKSIESSRFNEALIRTEALITARPNYRLAHLIKGDLLMAHARPVRIPL